MNEKKISQLNAIILSGFVAGGSQGVYALQFEPGIGGGLEYTNNAKLTPDHEDIDWIAIGYLGAKIEENEGPFLFNATTSFTYNHYTENTFSDQNYFNLAAGSRWDVIRNRLDLKAQDFFTQQSVNSLDPNTPDNIQNTNVFSIGPNIYFPVSGRQKLTFSPLFQDFYYEDDNSDNRRYGVTGKWDYQLYPNTVVGFAGSSTKVKYEDEDLYPDYTINDAYFIFSGTRPRSEYTANLGGTYINRDRVDDQSGFSGDLTWLYHLTGRSDARVYLASELTDASEGLYTSGVTPDNGNFSNEQISGDVLRNNIITLTYLRKGDTLDSSIYGEARDLNYKEAPDDRKVMEIGGNLNYHVSAFVTTGLYGNYNRTKETDISRTDKYYMVGGLIGYSLSRKLRSTLDLRYRKENSTDATIEYDEISVFASLVYGIGTVPRSRRSYQY